MGKFGQNAVSVPEFCEKCKKVTTRILGSSDHYWSKWSFLGQNWPKIAKIAFFGKRLRETGFWLLKNRDRFLESGFGVSLACLYGTF